MLIGTYLSIWKYNGTKKKKFLVQLNNFSSKAKREEHQKSIFIWGNGRWPENTIRILLSEICWTQTKLWIQKLFICLLQRDSSPAHFPLDIVKANGNQKEMTNPFMQHSIAAMSRNLHIRSWKNPPPLQANYKVIIVFTKIDANKGRCSQALQPTETSGSLRKDHQNPHQQLMGNKNSLNSAVNKSASEEHLR